MSTKRNALDELFIAYTQARHDGSGIGARMIYQDAKEELERILERLREAEGERDEYKAKLEQLAELVKMWREHAKEYEPTGEVSKHWTYAVQSCADNLEAALTEPQP